MVDKSAPVDWEIARIARRQHGIVTTAQLIGVGLTKAAVSQRAGRGRLHRLHQGVYAVGHHALSDEARWMAAVLACGKGAVLSHGAAAAHWGPLRPLGAPLSTDALQRRPAAVVTVRDRIPVTTVARTLVDIRVTLAPYLVRRAIREAEFLGLGLGEIKTDRTRSELERYFLRLRRRYELPLPEVNVLIDGMTVDFLWPEARLVVETDSYATHGGTVAFENDRERDLRLRRLGYSVHHFSEQQLESGPAAVAADVAAALRVTRVA